MNALSIIPARLRIAVPHAQLRENKKRRRSEKTIKGGRKGRKNTHTHIQKPSGGGTSVGERRNGFNARCHSADASVKRSVGSHHASPTRTTNNKNKKRTIKSARTREARPRRCRRGTSVRTQISWLSAGLLFPQRRAATEAATGLVDTDAMCLYVLAIARIPSLFSKKKENKNEGLPATPPLPACLRRRTSALGIRFEGNVRVMGPSMESCHNHHRWRRKRTQTHTLTRTHSFHESRRRPTPLRSQTDRWYNTASGLIS